MKKILLTLTLIFVSLQSIAQSPLTIKAEIYSGDKLLGEPTIVVNQNTESSISVSDQFNLTLNAVETKDKAIFIETIIETGSEKHSPSLLVERGKKAEVKIGDTTLKLFVAK